MKLCFYGPETDHRQILALLDQLPEYCGRIMDAESFSDYDSFVAHLPLGGYDAVIVTEDNADGMEGVIASCNTCPQVPVVWFSNDEGFGCQAYRLNTAFFHTKPITAPVLEMALWRLDHRGC